MKVRDFVKLSDWGQIDFYIVNTRLHYLEDEDVYTDYGNKYTRNELESYKIYDIAAGSNYKIKLHIIERI